jgi:hypothetical protein
MEDQTSQQAPRAVIEALDVSVRDVAAGRVRDASSVQHEACHMLDEVEMTRSGSGAAPAGITRAGVRPGGSHPPAECLSYVARRAGSTRPGAAMAS